MTAESANFLHTRKQTQELLLQIAQLRTELAKMEKSLQEEYHMRASRDADRMDGVEDGERLIH